MSTTKRQLSFYAESDVDLYLSLVGIGSKTAILNDAIRNRIITDAIVDLNDGRRPQPFAALSDHEMAEVHSNLTLEELSLNDVDDHVWEIVRETANHSWKQNTARYLALHHAKFKESFKIKRIRSVDEFMQQNPAAKTNT
ncbi:MAG: hypothetical protein K8L99_24840 [Anaerolineae bacterium]|nr:hypothetical protein [Anaerolineae bacterium]